MAIPLAHVPSPEEQAYIERCGQAIDAGAEAAQESATAGDAEKYAKFADGVATLVGALLELKTGGKSAGNAQPPGTSARTQ
jgi:hypothetical protein